MKSNTWSALILALLMAPVQTATAQNAIRIRIENKYVVNLNLGFGYARRGGIDSVEGTLTLQADGTWTGKVRGRVKLVQELKGLGENCPLATHDISQRLAVVATKATNFNTASHSITYSSGSASGGFLALEVKPDSEPSTMPGQCLEMHLFETTHAGTLPLLPLNDGRWTNPPPFGYVIGLPQRGVLDYVDDGGVACDPTTLGRVPCSVWRIRVERW